MMTTISLFFKKLFFLIAQLKVIQRINQTLNNQVLSSGIEDEFHFIQLKNGKYFFSYESKPYLKRLHFLLKKSIKDKIHPNAMNVLFDIDFRYMSRSSKELNFKEGKYLDIQPGDTVFEVGAFIGFHAMKMSELVGKTGKVIAIEAIPSNFALLQKNIQKNNIQNIIPFNLAIWNEKGHIPFHLEERQKNSALKDFIKTKQTTDLPCDTIDNIFKDLNLTKLDFIRIQTNGAELEALLGMKEVLELKPKILVAVLYKNKEKIQEILEKLNYQTTFTGHSIFAVSEK
jgi:FkbM family methyltransferase